MDQIRIIVSTDFGYDEQKLKIFFNRILFNLRSNLFEFSIEGSNKIDKVACIAAMQNHFPIIFLCSFQETYFKLSIHKNAKEDDSITLLSLAPILYTPKKHINIPYYVLKMLKICDQMLICNLETMCCIADGERR